MRALDRGNAWLPAVGGLVALAWLTLAIWEQTPYGRFLDHGRWTEIGLGGVLCRVLPSGQALLPALLYVTGWLLMIVAMMLPTVVPLLAIFARMTRDRADRSMLMTLLIVGYLTAWAGFAVLAHVADIALHALVAENVFLALNGWIFGVIVLAIAGAFQFSKLKYDCLHKCRTPFSFVNERWHGAAVHRQSYMLGLHHGIFCVGCCWAIMLLMFILGTGSVGWMLAIGALMAIEKNASWGRRLSAPLGGGLLLASIATLALNI
jgi:predicted metal-binding membrane protein